LDASEMKKGPVVSRWSEPPEWRGVLLIAGEVYRVDLGMGGKVRLMVVVSRQDEEAPRALSLCVPITTAYRGLDMPIQQAIVHRIP